MKRICKICGEPEDKHHKPDWLEIPDGCVCDWRTWEYEGETALLPICKDYQGDGKQRCLACAHDRECHAK